MLVFMTTAFAAEVRGKKALVSSWEGRTVMLTRPLYSIVYNERARFMPVMKRESQVTGLTVATPAGTYYQFDSRRDEEPDIRDADPMKVITALQHRYRRSAHLDEGTVQDVEAVLLQRYEPGVTMLVSRVQVDADRLRVFLRSTQDEDHETTLTVQWPSPLSKNLVEAPVLEDLLGRFLRKP
jgi:hypothetical protein